MVPEPRGGHGARVVRLERGVLRQGLTVARALRDEARRAGAVHAVFVAVKRTDGRVGTVLIWILLRRSVV